MAHTTPALKKPKGFLAKTPKAERVTLRKDKNGFYCHTHRARSKSYKTAELIPKSVIESIEATG
jgi:hypothetical protein